MIVARHLGRLGNNMFQISTAIGYARKYGYQWAADTSSGHGEPYSSIHKTFPNLPKQAPGGNSYQEHPNKHCRIHGVHYDLCHFDYHEIPNMGPDVTLTGFFQSYKYFEHCQDEVKKVFALPHVAGFEDYVSVHIRRGDYVQHAGSFPPITTEYISEAMASITEIKQQRNESADYGCLIFSDDIQWVKDNWKDKIFIHSKDKFIEGNDELGDLSLMASCGHHIIANSTFSWWAAYLGHNPDRITVTPSAETWFGPDCGVKRPVVDLLLPNWIQIHTR